MERLNFNNTEAQIKLTELCPVLEELPETSPVPSTNLNAPVLYVALQMEPCSWHKALLSKPAGLLVQNLFPHSQTCPTSKHPFPRFIKCFFHSQASGHTYFLCLKCPLPLNLFLEYLYLYFKTEFKCHLIYQAFFLYSANSLLAFCHKTTTHL